MSAVSQVAGGRDRKHLRTMELVRLCAAGLLAYCSYAICRSPLLPLFARELGADAPMIGFIVGASTLTGVALKLPAGAWSDIVGRCALLVTGAAVFAVMPFTYLAVSGLGLLIALRVVHGSATAIFGPVASASVSDIAPSHRRATWLSAHPPFRVRDRRSDRCSPATSSRCAGSISPFCSRGPSRFQHPSSYGDGVRRFDDPARATGRRCDSFQMASRRSRESLASWQQACAIGAVPAERLPQCISPLPRD